MALRIRVVCSVVLLALTAQAPAQISPVVNGAHPEQHAPPGVVLPVWPRRTSEQVTVMASKRQLKRYRKTLRRERKRHWPMTAKRSRSCKRKYRSFNRRTGMYRTYSGLRRKCVL